MNEKVVLVVVAILATVVPGQLLAACPDGKIEEVFVTPSGRQHTRCVSDNASQGQDQAAENANAEVIVENCPCFTVADMDNLSAEYPFTCSVDRYRPLIQSCYLDETDKSIFGLLPYKDTKNVRINEPNPKFTRVSTM